MCGDLSCCVYTWLWFCVVVCLWVRIGSVYVEVKKEEGFSSSRKISRHHRHFCVTFIFVLSLSLSFFLLSHHDVEKEFRFF